VHGFSEPFVVGPISIVLTANQHIRGGYAEKVDSPSTDNKASHPANPDKRHIWIIGSPNGVIAR
jgi:hypothetical protein